MNVPFVIFAPDGSILRTGECPADALESQANDQECVIQEKACCQNDAVNPKTKKVTVGAKAKQASAVQTAMQFQPPRLSVEVKIDLLWQAMDAGAFPKAEPFYSAIKAEKKPAK